MYMPMMTGLVLLWVFWGGALAGSAAEQESLSIRPERKERASRKEGACVCFIQFDVLLTALVCF